MPLVLIPGLFCGEVDGYYVAHHRLTSGSERSGNNDVLAVAMAKAGERVAAGLALEPVSPRFVRETISGFKA